MDHYNIIAIDLSKQQALDADPKALQQIKSENLNRRGGATIFVNNLTANLKLSKNQLSKIRQSGGFLDRLLRPLLKSGLPLMKNVLKN